MCLACYDEMAAMWRTYANRATDLDRYYVRKYDLSLEDYGLLFVKQRGACAICRITPESKPLVVDHDHATGAVRGLLCSTCNSAIGLLKDDPEVIVQAALYLYNDRLPG